MLQKLWLNSTVFVWQNNSLIEPLNSMKHMERFKETNDTFYYREDSYNE